MPTWTPGGALMARFFLEKSRIGGMSTCERTLKIRTT